MAEGRTRRPQVHIFKNIWLTDEVNGCGQVFVHVEKHEMQVWKESSHEFNSRRETGVERPQAAKTLDSVSTLGNVNV